jgi:hypothetical protein
MEVGGEGDDRRNKNNQVFQGVHMHAKITFKYIVASGCGRLHPEFTPRPSHITTKDHIFDQC